MSNPNLSSLLFIYLMIISSCSFTTICMANEFNEEGFLHPQMCGTSKKDMPQTTFEDHRREMADTSEGGAITKAKETFNYVDGDPLGPKNWGTLKPDWKVCSDGKSQSPINIDVNIAQVIPIDFKRAYLDAPAQLISGYNNFAVLWQGDAGGIELNGSAYKLVQCHWHTPSEHTIDGKRFDAEVHLVHKNDKNQIAVVGVLQNIGPHDPFIGNLTEKIDMVNTTEKIDLGMVSAANIKEGSKRNYRYIGSLTTPPCTEGVVWTVEEKVRSISQEQLNLLKGTHQSEFRENARPIQQLGERQIWRFDLPDAIE